MHRQMLWLNEGERELTPQSCPRAPTCTYVRRTHPHNSGGLLKGRKFFHVCVYTQSKMNGALGGMTRKVISLACPPPTHTRTHTHTKPQYCGQLRQQTLLPSFPVSFPLSLSFPPCTLSSLIHVCHGVETASSCPHPSDYACCLLDDPGFSLAQEILEHHAFLCVFCHSGN